MSDGREIRIESTPAVSGVTPVHAVQHHAAAVAADEHKAVPDKHSAAAATTGGTMRQAYAQFDVNPDTHDVVLRIRDATTDQVISETPSREVQAMSKYLNDYAATMARHRAAFKAAPSN
jgi:hypothetical protein